MCAREGLGREGMPGPEREEGEGALEVVVISRDGTDRQRADYRARPLTFHELHVTAAVGCKHRQSWSVFSGTPRHPLAATPLSLTDNTRFPQLPILNPCEPPDYSSRLRSLSVGLTKF